MYYEAKVLFVLYLWHPKTSGALYLYNTFVQPLLEKNEALIDQSLEEAKTSVVGLRNALFSRSEDLGLPARSDVHHEVAHD